MKIQIYWTQIYLKQIDWWKEMKSHKDWGFLMRRPTLQSMASRKLQMNKEKWRIVKSECFMFSAWGVSAWFLWMEWICCGCILNGGISSSNALPSHMLQPIGSHI